MEIDSAVYGNVFNWIIALGYILANGAAFGITYARYYYDPAFHYTRLLTSGNLPLARGAAACINLNAALVILPACRNLVSLCRQLAPFPLVKKSLDANIKAHKIIAYALMAWSLVHILSHYLNIYALSYSWVRWVSSLLSNRSLFLIQVQPLSPETRTHSVLSIRPRSDEQRKREIERNERTQLQIDLYRAPSAAIWRFSAKPNRPQLQSSRCWPPTPSRMEWVSSCPHSTADANGSGWTNQTLVSRVIHSNAPCLCRLLSPYVVPRERGTDQTSDQSRSARPAPMCRSVRRVGRTRRRLCCAPICRDGLHLALVDARVDTGLSGWVDASMRSLGESGACWNIYHASVKCARAAIAEKVFDKVNAVIGELSSRLNK